MNRLSKELVISVLKIIVRNKMIYMRYKFYYFGTAKQASKIIIY